MKKILFTCLIIVASSSAYAWDNEPATDQWGAALENKWGAPVYVDSITRKPVDEDGFGVKGQDIYNSGGIGRYDYDKPIYDSDGFKADRWGNN